MAAYLIEPGQMGEPGELLSPENANRIEQYKADGIYEYSLKANGRRDKSRLKISYYEGDIYEGTLRLRKYAGHGKYTWKEGGQYEGNFRRGKLSGAGKYTGANGDIFEGNFKNNKYHGSGKYTWADGSSFEGEFKNGRIQNGRFTDVDGNVYTCKFKYKLNGERKTSQMQLIKKAAPKAEEKHEEKKDGVKRKQAKQNKNGLQSKDSALLTTIRKSAQGNLFKNLYSGASGNSEKSEKDLMAILDFFTNSDAEQMQRIYKSSKIYDASKGPEHLTNMVNGAIKNSQTFMSEMTARTRTNQCANNSAAGAAR